MDGGSLTGTITTSDDLSALLGFDVSSTAMNSIYGNFTAAHYTLANATFDAWNPAQGLTALFASPSAQLNLYFASPLTASGAPFAVSSSESQIVQNGGARYATAGDLTAAVAAVPEPATWAMMLIGFGAVDFGLRHRSRQSVRVTYA